MEEQHGCHDDVTKAELDLHEEMAHTDAKCADFAVTMSARDLETLRANYEHERFSAVCGWMNYNKLKKAVEDAGYSPYNPSRLKDENEKLLERVKELEDQIAARDDCDKVRRDAFGDDAVEAQMLRGRVAYEQDVRCRIANQANKEQHRLGRELAELRDEHRDTCAKLADSESEIERLKKKVEELESQSVGTCGNAVIESRAGGRIVMTQAAFDALEQRANKAELEVAELRRRITYELSGGVRDVQSELSKIQHEHDKVCNYLVKSHKCIDELTEKLSKAEKGRDDRQRERDKERMKVKSLRDRVSTVEHVLHDAAVIMRGFTSGATTSSACRQRIGELMKKHSDVIDSVFPF